MTIDQHQLQRVARQHLRTNNLLGVDFVPVVLDHPSKVDAVEEVAQTLEKQGSATNKIPSDRHAALEALNARHDQECPHCTTVTTHTRTVFGEGDPYAKIMFIGEAPGEDEDRTGRPFVGRAGQKLNDIIRAMGFEREQVYIANILKSRPPNNRTPLEHEVAACSPYLAEQIRIIQPQVIVSLGGPASKMLLQTDLGITRLRGSWAVYRDPNGQLSVPVMPTFHPAYLLRNYTTDTRQKMWSDMQAVLARVQPG